LKRGVGGKMKVVYFTIRHYFFYFKNIIKIKGILKMIVNFKEFIKLNSTGISGTAIKFK
jgi:hypothetical protein